jgi:hypothetical protein
MKVYRDRQTLIGLFFRGSLLFYVGIDNIIEGPLRTYLAGIFNLKEFGTNLREEYLYYLILVLGVFQLYVFLQNVFLPIVEVAGAKVLFRTPNAALSVVKNIDEIKDAEFNEEKILKLTFVKKSYDVNLKDVDENEVEKLFELLKLREK